MYEEGDLSAGIVSCGQGVGRSNNIPTVKELFDNMANEAEQVIKSFSI